MTKLFTDLDIKKKQIAEREQSERKRQREEEEAVELKAKREKEMKKEWEVSVRGMVKVINRRPLPLMSRPT